MEWTTDALIGPDGEDWRVPTSELEIRQSRFVTALEGKSAWVNDPVDMYWLVGNRQAGGAHFSARWKGDTSMFAIHWNEPGTNRVEVMHLTKSWRIHACQHSRIRYRIHPHCNSAGCPHRMRPSCNRNWGWVAIAHSCFGLYEEQKSDWEIERMRESGEIQRWMFEAIDERCEGVTELDLAACS